MRYRKIVCNPSFSYIIFIHGWNSSYKTLIPFKDFFHNKFNMIFVILDAVDSKILHPLTIEDYVDELNELINKNKIESFIGVGHSFGGKILGFYQKKYPKKVKSLFLLSPSLFKQRKKLTTIIRISIYKFLKYCKSPLSKKMKGSKDYKQIKTELWKKTFINVSQKYWSNKEIKNNTCKIILYGFVKDREVKLKTLKRIVKKNKLIKCYSYSGNHFGYIYHLRAISNSIMENI